MNKNILNTGVQVFISEFWKGDILSVSLKKSPFAKVSPAELTQQLYGKKKSENKLPSWHNTPGIYFPESLHLEQASSEISARYKATLISGNSLIDLTGGMGVDTYSFSQRFKEVIYCEKNDELAEITKHNFQKLGANNIAVAKGNGMEILARHTAFDWIYADPSRRDPDNKRVFKLKDCEPDIPDNLPFLFKKSDQIMLKLSPMLDLSAVIKELGTINEIQIVAVNNEVKEVLCFLKKNFKGATKITAVNLGKAGSRPFTFYHSEESETIASYGVPNSYLYEPNAAILKSGAFKSVGNRYSLEKLHPHSHLYTSEILKEFPGKRFKISQVIPYKKKALKALNIAKANITTRNFPVGVSQLRKSLKIKPGGNITMFFTTDLNDNLIVIVCEKISNN